MGGEETCQRLTGGIGLDDGKQMPSAAASQADNPARSSELQKSPALSACPLGLTIGLSVSTD
jgi:hypothetical protein